MLRHCNEVLEDLRKKQELEARIANQRLAEAKLKAKKSLDSVLNDIAARIEQHPELLKSSTGLIYGTGWSLCSDHQFWEALPYLPEELAKYGYVLVKKFIPGNHVDPSDDEYSIRPLKQE